MFNGNFAFKGAALHFLQYTFDAFLSRYEMKGLIRLLQLSQLHITVMTVGNQITWFCPNVIKSSYNEPKAHE